MDRGAWRATVHRAAKSDMTEATTHACTHFQIYLLGVYKMQGNKLVVKICM